VSSDFWSVVDRYEEVPRSSLKVRLRAAYTDGHVATYEPTEVLTIKASMTYDGRTPYPSAIEPGGNFYIPADAVK
jgi:hypothetical protein